MKRAEVQRAKQMQAEEQITSEKISFFLLPRLSQGTNRGESQSYLRERDDIRESARAFYIILYIFVEKRETEDNE